jgi:hypothetical protein
LVGDEFSKVGVGEHFSRALRTVADDDIAQRAGGDVTAQRPQRTADSVGRFAH